MDTLDSSLSLLCTCRHSLAPLLLHDSTRPDNVNTFTNHSVCIPLCSGNRSRPLVPSPQVSSRFASQHVSNFFGLLSLISCFRSLLDIVQNNALKPYFSEAIALSMMSLTRKEQDFILRRLPVQIREKVDTKGVLNLLPPSVQKVLIPRYLDSPESICGLNPVPEVLPSTKVNAIFEVVLYRTILSIREQNPFNKYNLRFCFGSLVSCSLILIRLGNFKKLEKKWKLFAIFVLFLWSSAGLAILENSQSSIGKIKKFLAKYSKQTSYVSILIIGSAALMMTRRRLKM